MDRSGINEFNSFGEWIQSRRQGMKLTREELAKKVGCAAVTIKKIERGERRPSEQIAQLLADQLAIPSLDRDTFLRMARGSLTVPNHAVEETLRIPDFLQQEVILPATLQGPFVERWRELARLENFLQQALDGRGLPVFILGEAGSGKTSLMREFVSQAQESHPGLLAAAGLCNAQTGPGDPYRPFRDILGMLTGDLDILRSIGLFSRAQAIQLWATIPNTIQAVTSRGPHLINTLLPAAQLERRIAPGLFQQAAWFDRFQALAQAQQSSPMTLEPDQVTDEVTQVLRAIARIHPLLLILDDLQWVDDASLNLLSHLGRRLAGSRILLLGAYRTGEALTDQPSGEPASGETHSIETLIGEFVRYYGDIQVNLDQAIPAEAKAFIQAIVDLEPNHLGAEFRDILFQHTRGNPLFTVEVLHSMKENQNLVRDASDCWVENSSSLPVVLPARVEAIIEQRLRRLNPAMRKLLSLASVEGEVFTAQIAAHILKLDLTTVLQRLSQDLSKQLHLVQEQSELHAHALRLDRFQFRHKLFQDYLYDQLGAGEKHQYHREIAEAFEKMLLGASSRQPHGQYPRGKRAAGESGLVDQDDLDAFGPALLHHFWQGGVWDKAATYAQKLGKRARQRYAMREAIAYYDQAIHAFDRQARTPDVHLIDTLIDWEEAALKFKPYQEQLDRLARAEAIARNEQDPRRLIQALNWTANVFLERGLWTRAGPALTECLALAEQLGIEQLSVRPVFFKALMTTFSDPVEALELLGQAEQLARKYNDLHIEALAFATYGHVLAQLGRFDQARQSIETARQISNRLGSPLTESDVDLMAAWAYLAMGDREQALEFGQHSVEKAISTDNMDCICNGMACIGYSNLELGKIPEAASAFEKGIERSEIPGAMIPKLNGQAGLAMTRFLTGHTDAVDELERVEIDMSLNQHFVGAANTNRMLGSCLTGLGAYDRAASRLNQAVAFYRRSQMQPFLARALLSLAELMDIQGDQAEAQRHRDEAEAILLNVPTISIPSTPAA